MLGTIRDRTTDPVTTPAVAVLHLGENTAEATRQAGLAAASATSAAASDTGANASEASAAASAAAALASATAIARYFTSKAAGEAGSTTGQFFSYPDGSGGLIYAEKTSGSSTEIARAATMAGIIPALATTADITTGSFAAAITRLQTRGFATANDGGAAVYERTTASLSAGSGVWWFTAADASKWQIAKASEHMAAQFGALGGAGIDARPILNAALASDQVAVVNLGALTHYITGATSGDGSILPPSGKRLVGINRKVSLIKLVPVTLGTQSAEIPVICFVDDEHGFARDFTIDCQRSGVGGVYDDRVHGLTIRAKTTNGKGTRVQRVRVCNVTGYGHYESADSGRTLRDLVRDDCQSLNCQVGHETSGDVEVITIDPYNHSDSGNVWDGGASIACEAMFHEYGPAKVRLVRPRGYGHAGAGIYPSANALSSNIKSVIIDQPDIEVLNAVPGLQTDGSASYKTEVLEVNGGRIVSGGSGVSFTHVLAGVVRGTKIIGGQGGVGAGVVVSAGATLDIFDADVTGHGLADIAAFGVYRQDTGVVRWHGGGKLTATGGASQISANDGVIFVDGSGPIASPAVASLGTPLPGYRQRKRGTKAPGDWALYNTDFSYVNIVLDTAVASRALTDIMLTLQYADGSVAVQPNDLSVSYNWQSDTTIQVQIPPGVVTTNLTLKYSIIEWVS